MFSTFMEEAALRTGVPQARQNLALRFCASQSLIGFAKAGIGGFHTAMKQLAGKACNGVIAKDMVFRLEPLPGDRQRAFQPETLKGR